MPILGLIIGGALGTLCRYLTTVATQSLLPSSAFPLATLTVNVLGCFLIGMLSHLGPAGHVSPTAHLALGYLSLQLGRWTATRLTGGPM